MLLLLGFSFKGIVMIVFSNKIAESFIRLKKLKDLHQFVLHFINNPELFPAKLYLLLAELLTGWLTQSPCCYIRSLSNMISNNL